MQARLSTRAGPGARRLPDRQLLNGAIRDDSSASVGRRRKRLRARVWDIKFACRPGMRARGATRIPHPARATLPPEPLGYAAVRAPPRRARAATRRCLRRHGARAPRHGARAHGRSKHWAGGAAARAISRARTRAGLARPAPPVRTSCTTNTEEWNEKYSGCPKR